jgi:FlaA1/EpsC-like NDP-sugar epimerase
MPPFVDIMNYRKSAAVIIIIYLIFFYIFKLYDTLWRYAGVDEYLLAVGGCVASGLVSALFGIIVGRELPFSISFLAGVFTVMLVVGFRVSFKIRINSLLSLFGRKKREYKRVMIVGAGAAGLLVVKEMRLHRDMGYEPVVIIDDDKSKIGTTIAGIKVLGNKYQIETIVKNKKIDMIILAIPSIDEKTKGEILRICKKTGCRVKIVPGVYELLDNVPLDKIRDIEVEDLLGRDPVKLDMNGIADYIKGKVILVTGGGGSIGSELCRQIARFNPSELAILDIYENNAYDLQNELEHTYPDLKLNVIIASVRDRARLENVFHRLRPDVVFHAAAHKHVPLMEYNPSEAVKNNIFGTLNAAECADKYGVKRFVMISTDKAVNPTNVMGATKRACEMIVQAMDKISKTRFVAVRFGNVLGSNGSVIPLFKRQIAQGGPVTVTHKDITRFFMTIPEAAQLVLQAGAFAEGGEIFILDMGQAVRIYDLACDLIRLSGYEPNKDIKIEISGLRPGEKLYEEVLMSEEGLRTTRHDKIFVGNPTFDDMERLKERLNYLGGMLKDIDDVQIIRELEQLVPTYARGAEAEVASTIS